MKVNSNEFCYLSTSESFLSWLYRSAPSLHKALIEHLQKGLGCNENRKKMLEILNDVQKEDTLAQSLAQFLREYYPQIILEDDQDVEIGADVISNKHRVFKHYDPILNTYPRRLIIIERPDADIKRDVLSFCSQQGYCEHLIIEDRAYIEYLPPEHLALKDDIPEKNWEIKEYKRANKIYK